MSFSSFTDQGIRHHSYSRKQKSLGLLCSNFLALYNRDDVDSIGLDEAAHRLGVERRRIYDIVNVLESVGVLARKGKNCYTWKGFAGIPQALEKLREEIIRRGSCSASRNALDDVKISDDDEDENTFHLNGDMGQCSSLPKASSSSTLPSKTKPDCRREKSLGLLTQNFVKLFISTDTDLVSLDEAARLLLGDSPESSHLRTKVRRLYDIANVLSSVNLIEKTHHAETRKPAFRWLGLKGKATNNTVSVKSLDVSSKECRKREFGTDISNNDLKRNKVVSVVQKPNTNIQTKTTESIEDYHGQKHQQQRHQQQSSKGYVFGPFCPVRLSRANQENGGKKVQDWESLAASYRPQYQNQGAAGGELWCNCIMETMASTWRHRSTYGDTWTSLRG